MNLFAAKFTGKSGERTSGAQSAPNHSRRPGRSRGGALARPTRLVAAVSALLLPVALGLQTVAATAAVAPVGQGFTVTASDLAFILKQIKIAEHHAATLSPAHPCDTMIGTGPDQIPDALTSYGLRTVDGSCNNLIPGREKFAAADQPFPRLTTPVFKAAEPITASFPVGPLGPTSYAQKKGSVIDSQPRLISNLIDDQTSTNPAAVAAAQFPVRTQGNTGLLVCTTDPVPAVGATPAVPGVPAGCVPSHKTLFIPNVTTDVGLSPPYNSLFTFFGQFFDHGVDQTAKSGGTVFVPLHADDPLITVGPDGIAGTGDEVPASQAFMVLTRAQNQPGPDGVLGDVPPTNIGATACSALNIPAGCDESADDVQDANNTDSPWVDQSQTYTSHPSHQVFLREYDLTPGLRPVSTGKLLGGLGAGLTYAGSPDGRTGIGTWAAVKAQAAAKLGLLLVDRDVTNIPMLATDPYGKFIPGPLRGLPQYVTATGKVEGNIAAPVAVPANALHFDTPFLTDIAHNADPSPADTDNNPATPPVVPTPDPDASPSANFALQPLNTYDDEMLNAHFACGDGRCNENIALSTIHQVFHSEHDRLVDDIKNTLTNDTSPSGVLALSQWQATTPNGWNGERLFQAARYVNEMEYQHLVFEEFARKVQPAVRPFHVYSPDINPAVKAEFAHAVYRFGHSMLDEDVARTNTAPTVGQKADNSVPLLTAFLNPPEFFNSGAPASPLTPEQAAGQVVMGSSDQVGNELDEFVTDTLRSNLLGLPLDLPTLNMARARDAGVPPLNNLRRQIFAQTNDGQLKPYTSWSDFGQNIKHPESLINFVAAYGTHASITSQTTLAGKRAAARAIVNPLVTDIPPADAADFMFGTGIYANTPTGVTTTGVDDIDLWVGGLAEITNLFGGLLGSTFNYVFQTQLENLQDGDRFYYLNRTPGMNLRSQLEGNSFSELIMRNTDGTNTLKADAFATADCKFQLANLTSPATLSTAVRPVGYPAQLLGAGSVNDDVTSTDCDENLLLLKKPDGTIQYRQVNAVDPVGINGQSVYNGTDNPLVGDRIWGGNDNDTFWGGAGNDVIEGNGGDDIALGGDGNDVITDLSGADVLKGGPGNDALDGGIGDDIFMGGDGQDFINGGANDNESFAGPGNDFIIAGQGADAVFGDGGDDWIQGGSGQDLLIGDHSAPFFDDPAEAAPGNDIFVGQVGENDYDSEGGDDIMAQNAAVDRNAGAGGFDWAIHQYDTVGADDDMNINNNLVGVPIQVVVNRDRWQETEADSGSAFNDVIRGDDAVPSATGGAGFTGCDALDQAGIDRIVGLNALVTPAMLAASTTTAASVAALSAPGACPLVGNVWGDGNILLGGTGSDKLEGRGGNDIIDGDRSLEVRIAVRVAGTEIGSTDLMEHAATTGTFGPGTTGMTLQQAVFAGLVDPGNLVAARRIVTPAVSATDVDTAVFSGLQADYTVTTVSATGGAAVLGSAGSVTTVVDNIGVDGTDTLRNIERLAFSDTVVPVAPVIGLASAGVGSATVRWTPPAGVLTGFVVEASTGGTVFSTSTVASGTATSTVVTGLTNGLPFTFKVAAVNTVGTGAQSSASNVVTPSGPVATVPGAPTIGTATPGNTTATVNWTAPANGGSPITGYSVEVQTAAGVVVGALRPALAGATNLVVTNLTNGTSYRFHVRATNAVGTGLFSALSTAVTPATVPGAPTIGTATPGNTTATVNWTAPANGGSPITGYSVEVQTAAGVVVGALRPALAGATSLVVTSLTNGTSYRFHVRATNAAGTGAFSALSTAVTPAATPGAPTIGVATAGIASALVRWTAPASNGGSAITGYSVRVANAATNVQVGALRPAVAGATTLSVTGLANGTALRFQVQARNLAATGAFSALSTAITPATVPGAALIAAANPGAIGGTITATANWTPPVSNGGLAINGYVVTALRINAAGTVLATTTSAVQAATVRSLSMTLVAGNYRFTVRARNPVGLGAASGRSNLVTAR